jgi:hypothetical protein
MALYLLEGQLMWPAFDHNLISTLEPAYYQKKNIRTNTYFIRSFLG